MIQRVHHTSFTVSSLERSVAFYRDVLRMQFVNEQGGRVGYLAEATGFPDVDMRIAFLRPTPGSDHLLELIEYRSPVGTPADVRTCNPGAAHLCLVVDDILGLHRRLVAAGVAVRSPAPVAITQGPRKGGYLAYFSDPDGITLELLQLPPGA